MNLSRRALLTGVTGLAAGAITGKAEAKPPPGKGPKIRPRSLSKAFSDGVGLREYNIIVGPSLITGLMGWQLNPTNTGLARLGINGNSLPTYSGPAFPAAGTTITEKKIDVGEMLVLEAGGITIERCLIKPTTVQSGFGVLGTWNYNTGNHATVACTIRDCDIDGSLIPADRIGYAVAGGGLCHFYRNYCHDIGSGLFPGDEEGVAVSLIMEGNYITSLFNSGTPPDNSHADGAGVRNFPAQGGRTLLVKNNRIDCDATFSTGAFFVQCTTNIVNVTLQGNLLEGNGNNLVLEGGVVDHDYDNMRAVNNRFFGPGGTGYVAGGEGWTEWAENYVWDSGAVDGKGAVVLQP